MFFVGVDIVILMFGLPFLLHWDQYQQSAEKQANNSTVGFLRAVVAVLLGLLTCCCGIVAPVSEPTPWNGRALRETTCTRLTSTTAAPPAPK